MTRPLRLSHAVVAGALCALACGGRSGARRVASAAPIVTLAPGPLVRLTDRDRELLDRHFRSSLAWSLTVVRGQRYATRRMLRAGQWVDGSNGFQSSFSDASLGNGVYQSRVLVGLDGEYGIGNESSRVTRSPAAAGAVPLTLSRDGDQPSLQSYLVVKAPIGLTIEVFEQSDSKTRSLTQASVAEVEAELAAVLAQSAELLRSGVASDVAPAGSARREPGPVKLVLEDGMQGGMFTASAWLNPGEPGACFMRVYFPGASGPEDRLPDELRGRHEVPLSADRIEPSSTQLVGWGAEPSLRFLYQQHFTVYEGDWEHHYPARFELWFRGAHGERKLAESSRHIAGWQR